MYYPPASEKCNVYDGSERIEELQDEGFEDQPFFKALICFRNLWGDKHIAQMIDIYTLHCSHELKEVKVKDQKH